ncbi:MAG: hypothetical protein ACQGQO_03625 [Sphaerochaetaceae bacterium]
MKKIFAIMLIAVIAVAGVFATNPTNLTLTYKVNDLVTRTFTFADAKEGTISYGDSFSVGNNGEGKGIVEGSKTFYIVDTSYANIAAAANAKSMTVTVTVGDSTQDLDNWKSATYTSTSVVSIGTMAINTGLASDTTTLKYSTAAETDGVKTTYTLGLVDRTAQNAANNWIASIPVSWTTDAIAPAGEYSVALVVVCVAP